MLVLKIFKKQSKNVYFKNYLPLYTTNYIGKIIANMENMEAKKQRCEETLAESERFFHDKS